MYIARILYPVEVLGPGKRVGIWFCGCPRRCEGCSNPELWEFDEKYKTSPERIYKLIKDLASEHPVDGFTLTGGDPVYQADALYGLITLLKEISDDIILYTGYGIKQVPPNILSSVTLLIDGEYVEELNDNSLLRGSSNQTIHILDKKKEEKYKKYLSSETNKIQNFFTSDGVISVGIHRPDF